MVQRRSNLRPQARNPRIGFKERVLSNFTAAYSVHKVFGKYTCIEIIYCKQLLAGEEV
jgi:hypothetical protein